MALALLACSSSIQRMGGCFPVIREMPIDQMQTEQADREIYEKNNSPMKVTHDKTAGDGTEHGAN